METDQIEEMDVEVLPSMWPDDVGTEADKQFNVEKSAGDLDMLKEVDIAEQPAMADLIRLPELMNRTDLGTSQLTKLVKQWEYTQDHAVRLLREELKILTRQREEAEAKELKIIEEHNFESQEEHANVPVLDETSDLSRRFRQKKRHELVDSKKIEVDEEFDTIAYCSPLAPAHEDEEGIVKVETDVQVPDNKEEPNEKDKEVVAQSGEEKETGAVDAATKEEEEEEERGELINEDKTEEQIEEPREPEKSEEDKEEVEKKVDDDEENSETVVTPESTQEDNGQDKEKVEKKADEEENCETVVTPDMKEAANVEESKEEEEAEVKEEESESSNVKEGVTETKA